MKLKSQAYLLGREAWQYIDGKTNPFGENSQEYLDWEDGWMDAQAKYESDVAGFNIHT
jgi:hypothetical protein